MSELTPTSPTEADEAVPFIKRKRVYVPTGRPKGSKTRPKAPEMLPMLKPVTMRISTAARYADVSQSLIRKWIKRGKVQTVPSEKIATMRLVLVESLDALLQGRG
jgi:hypothetical protein